MVIMRRETASCLIFLLGFLYALTVEAQTFTLHGKVSDENNNPLELATVAVPKQGHVTFTNLKGEYNIQLSSADSVEVRFSMVGYQTKTRVLRKPKGVQTLIIQLTSDNELDELLVIRKRRQTGQSEELDTKDMKNTPSVTGNAVEELIQSQAGVSTHNELSSQYNVRGGSFDENSVYINNVEVFRPFLVRSGQQEGLSVINPDMVESISFSTGGFEAKYGDKMASALDITYKRPKALEGSVSASLLGGSAYLGVSNKKVSWSNGLRYKTNRYLLGSLETKGEYNPNFLDYQTYLGYHPNKRWTIDIIGNISENHYNFVPHDRETNFGTMENVKSFKVYFDGKEKDIFRTWFGMANISRHITDKTTLSLITSAFYTKEQEKYDIQGQYWLTQTETSENLGVGTYMEHARNTLDANRLETYVQDTWRWNNAEETAFYTLNYGVRFSHWNFNHESIVSPRVSLAIVPAFNNDVTFRLATGLYYQAPFFKELRDTTTINGITYATLNKKIKSQRSIHFIGAVDYRFKMRERNYRFSAEAYYKYLSNLVPYSVSNVKVVYYGQNEANGHAAGLDLKLYGEFVPGTDSWISISVMNTKMKLHGKSIPLPTDQRYALNLFFTDYFPNTERWKMSLKLAYADGLPFSAPHRGIENFNFRAPAYRRADIGMSFRALDNEKKTHKHNPLRNIWLGVDCLNLFGINNVNSYYWITDVTNQQYAVPNYLTGRQINGRVLVEF